MGLDSSIAIHEPLVPLLELSDLLLLVRLTLPSSGKFLLELAEFAERNREEVVTLWGDEKRQEVCEGGSHAP